MTIPFGINALQWHWRILVMDSDIQYAAERHIVPSIGGSSIMVHG
jgi:hypothetical protein